MSKQAIVGERQFDREAFPPSFMHIASKVTLILGALMLIASGIGFVGGIGTAIDAAERETYFANEQDGLFTVDGNESWSVTVFVQHPVDCDTLELSITDRNGESVISDCYLYVEDEFGDEGYADGAYELYGYINHDTAGMEYTVESNVEVLIEGEYCDEECRGNAIGGGIAALGGGLGICCSIPLIILGIILALVLDEPQKNVMMPTGHMPMGQVAYQAPVGQQMIQAPVGQQMIQAPVGQQMVQAPVGQSIQPAAVPHTPITPPLTQQPAQPAQSPWDNVQPPQ